MVGTVPRAFDEKMTTTIFLPQGSCKSGQGADTSTRGYHLMGSELSECSESSWNGHGYQERLHRGGDLILKDV